MRGRLRAAPRVFVASYRVELRGTMGKAKMSDRTRDARRMAKLFRDGGYSYDQSKHLIADGTMSCSTGIQAPTRAG